MAGNPLRNTNESQQIPLYYQPNTGGLAGDPTYIGFQGRGSVCLNMIPYATKQITGELDIILEKRQGFLSSGYNVITKSALSGTMSVRDLISINQLSDVMIAAFYRYNAGTVTIEIAQIKPVANTWVLIGTISTVVGPPAVNISEYTTVYLSEIKVGNVPGVAITITDRSSGAGTSAGYYALSSSGAFTAASLTKISDADFPTNQTPYVHIVGKIIQMNQIAYVMASDGRIYNSNDDTLGTWSALGFLEAQAYTDRGVGLERYKSHIVGFGENTIEFFNDVGTDPTTGSPLERMEQAFIRFGALYAKSIINIDDTLFWIGQSTGGTNNVWKLDGYTPIEIGNSRIAADIDTTKNQNTDILSLQLQQVVINSQKILFITMNTIDSFLGYMVPYLSNEVGETAFRSSAIRINAWLYNVKDGLWSTFNLSSSTATYLNNLHFYFAFQPYVNYQYCLFGEIDVDTPDNFGDMLLGFAPADLTEESYNYQDWSHDDNTTLPIACAWASPVLNFGTQKRKFLHKFTVQPIIQSGSFTASNAEYYKLIVSKGFLSGSSGVRHTRNIKVPDDFTTTPRIYGNRFGAFRDAQLGFLYQGNGGFSLASVEVDLSQGLG